MNEFRLAYESAAVQQQRPENVIAALEEGKFVVVSETLAYCPYTDAILPNTNEVLEATADTIEDAYRALFDACHHDYETYGFTTSVESFKVIEP